MTDVDILCTKDGETVSRGCENCQSGRMVYILLYVILAAMNLDVLETKPSSLKLHLATYSFTCAVRGEYYNGRRCHGADGQKPRATDYKICGQTDEYGKDQAYGVCGLQTRVSPRSAYDEMGLTDIHLLCCKDPKCKLFIETNVLLHL